MSQLSGTLAAHAPSSAERTNDFTIQAATVNGSGSQSANNVLMRAIFKMGVPVAAKNLFPSNIAGLPTWFSIRLSREGWRAWRREVDLLIALNPESASEDLSQLAPGAVVLYDEPMRLNEQRDDLTFYSMPFDQLAAESGAAPKLRKLVRNMLYVGAAAQLTGVEMSKIEEAIAHQFAGKPRASELNWRAAQAGFDYAVKNFAPQTKLRVEPLDKTDGQIIVDGNTAAALGAVFAGVSVVGWYPITPSTSLIETLIDNLHKLRRDAQGRASYAVVQAEDELAAAGMVIGAGWAGARAMTATSGPGFSLMSEFVGLGYYAEIPAVIWDVQRVGPSTGLPTRTSQGDILAAAFQSHGDTRHPLLLPASVAECFDFAGVAFDLAERLQTPVFVMSDLDLGMNPWTSPEFAYPDKPFDRGKVLGREELERLGGFARYKDVDGDGVGWRTLPGTQHPLAAYFTRGSGHNERSGYSERPADYVANMDRLARKIDAARALAPAPVVEGSGAKIGLIAYGGSHWAAEEARALLLRQGLQVDYLRLRAYPFHADVSAFVEQHESVYVVDQNRDGQMRQLLTMDLPPSLVGRLRSILHYDGLPLDAESAAAAILSGEAR